MGGFFARCLDFISRPTNSRTKGVLVVVVLVASVILTVLIVQQRQNLRQKAAAPPDPQSISCQDQASLDCGANDGSCIFAGKSCEAVIKYTMCFNSFTREQAEKYVKDNQFLCLPDSQ